MVVGEHLPAAGWAGLTLVSGCLAIVTAPRARSTDGRVLHGTAAIPRGPAERAALAAASRRNEGLPSAAQAQNWL
jgi:hypothetical protein